MSTTSAAEKSLIETVRVIEALIFASTSPLSLEALTQRLPEGAPILQALLQLKHDYEKRGIVLVEREGHWAFRTAPDIADSLTLHRQEERKLSRAALETLSIIAYHQPVTRPEIETIRGVATNKGTLDALLEAGWIRPGRRREVPGRPLTWVTTPHFLDYFALASLSDLPGLDEMRNSGLLDRRPASQVIPGADDLFSPDAEEDKLPGYDPHNPSSLESIA